MRNFIFGFFKIFNKFLVSLCHNLPILVYDNFVLIFWKEVAILTKNCEEINVTDSWNFYGVSGYLSAKLVILFLNVRQNG